MTQDEQFERNCLAAADLRDSQEGTHCPNCGEIAEFRPRYAHHIETHGLDCGPYEHWDEEWLECSACHAATNDKEISEANR